MMRESDFEAIQESLEKYQYTSLTYTDYEDVCHFEIKSNTEQLILLCGYNDTAKEYEYCWAANKAEDVISKIEKEKCLITFIPKEWTKTFENAGFSIRNIWHDYFKDNLDDVHDEVENAIVLKEEECLEASEVTLSCRNQSRGFTGESEIFLKEWLSNCDEDDQNKTIFVEKNEPGQIVGLVCTTTYAHDSEKGAVAWIREVCVHPEYQNRGIARKLIMQALSYGKAKGAKRAFLAADEMNDNAIHLYKSIGFEPSLEDGQIDMIR